MPNPLASLARMLSAPDPTDPEVIDAMQADVRRRIMPQQAVAGGAVEGISKAGVKITDPRPNGNLTSSKYSPQIIQAVITAAKQNHIDPALALAMSLQETTLGRYQPNNPMHENWAQRNVLQPELHNAIILGESADYSKTETPQHANAKDVLYRDATLNSAMQHVAELQKQHADAPEAHQIQAYNGLGRPHARYTFTPADSPDVMYGLPIDQLPKDFYGKRVQDIRDNFVNQSPYLQQLIKGIN